MKSQSNRTLQHHLAGQADGLGDYVRAGLQSPVVSSGCAEPDHWSCMKRAAITGIAGQDGTYLARGLLRRGYEVHGLLQSPSTAKSRSCAGAIRQSRRRISSARP